MATLKPQPKLDFPGIWQPGVQPATLDAVRESFTFNQRRKQLFRQLEALTSNIRLAGIDCTLWVWGSFMTSKPEPGDIDVIVWPKGRAYIARDQHHLDIAFNKHMMFAHAYLDMHIESLGMQEAFEREARWLGFAGYAWDRRTPRTIAQLTVEGSGDGA